MRTLMSQVREFHVKHGFPVAVPLDNLSSGTADDLLATSQVILKWSQYLSHSNLATARASLVLEETGEMLEALATGNEEGLLDALADLAYVVAGTAVSYGLPLAEATNEVHRSNMTKQVRQDRPGHPGKSIEEGYLPPDLNRVLKENRCSS